MAASDYPKYLTRKGVTRTANSLEAETRLRFDGFKPLPADAPAPAVTVDGSGGEKAPEPGGNASRDEWHAHRLAEGYGPDDLEGLTRDALRDLGPLEV